jgi:hypothetical protein
MNENSVSDAKQSDDEVIRQCLADYMKDGKTEKEALDAMIEKINAALSKPNKKFMNEIIAFLKAEDKKDQIVRDENSYRSMAALLYQSRLFRLYRELNELRGTPVKIKVYINRDSPCVRDFIKLFIA